MGVTMDLTLNEVEVLLTEHACLNVTRYSRDPWFWLEESSGRTEYVAGIGDVAITYGSDGDGIYLIFKTGDRYFKKDGWYASHDGTYWDGSFYEVEPAQKTITVYNPVKEVK